MGFSSHYILRILISCFLVNGINSQFIRFKDNFLRFRIFYLYKDVLIFFFFCLWLWKKLFWLRSILWGSAHTFLKKTYWVIVSLLCWLTLRSRFISIAKMTILNGLLVGRITKYRSQCQMFEDLYLWCLIHTALTLFQW